MKNSGFLALATIHLLAACGGRGVTVEGELTLDGTKGAYQSVSLVRNPGDSLLASIDALCEAERADVQRRAKRIQTFRATADRFRLAPAHTSVAQVMRADSVAKYRQAVSDEERAESERPDTTPRKIAALLRQATDTQVAADADGHYRFVKRQPGVYLLYFAWMGPTGDKEFLTRVDAIAGRKKTQNLDQAAVTTRLRCR